MKIRLERCVGYLSPGSQAHSPLTSASPVTRNKPRGQRGLLAQYLRCSRLGRPHLLMERKRGRCACSLAERKGWS